MPGEETFFRVVCISIGRTSPSRLRFLTCLIWFGLEMNNLVDVCEECLWKIAELESGTRMQISWVLLDRTQK